MKLSGIHHVAYRCKNAKQTVEWYGKYLGMDFVLAIAEDEVPSTKEPDPYMHVFLNGCPLNSRQEYAVTDTFRLSDTNSFGCGTFGAAGGFYGAVGPLEPGEHVLRIAVRNQGINFASASEYFTTESGAVNTYDSDNVFRLLVS